MPQTHIIELSRQRQRKQLITSQHNNEFEYNYVKPYKRLVKIVNTYIYIYIYIYTAQQKLLEGGQIVISTLYPN